MEFIVLTGDDQLAIGNSKREILFAFGGVHESLDIAVDEGSSLVSAVRTPSLFGPRAILAENIDKLSPEQVIELKLVAEGSDALVVGLAGGPLPAKLRALLGQIADIRRLDQPKGAAVAKEISRLAQELGIRLSGETIKLAATYSIGKVRSVLAMLAESQVESISLEALAAALGDERDSPPPWKLTDAVLSGDAGESLLLAGQILPVVGVSVLTSYFRQLCVIREDNVKDPERAMSILGVKHKFVAERTVRVAATFTVRSLGVALDILGQMALSARGDSKAVGFEVGVVQLATLERCL